MNTKPNDEEHKICEDVYYIHKMDHRNGSPEKSQWIIPCEKERDSFSKALSSNWQEPLHNCWGLHFDDSHHVDYLGTAKAKDEEKKNLFIAKFVDGNRNQKWHGYPADFMKNYQDIPPGKVLSMWQNENFLSRAIIRKITKGQKCKLQK